MKSEGPLARVPFVVSEASGDLIAAWRSDPLRIAMRWFNEASSALAYLHQHSHAFSDTEVID